MQDNLRNRIWRFNKDVLAGRVHAVVCLFALVFTSIPLTDSFGETQPLNSVQSQAQSQGTLQIIAVLIGLVVRPVAIYVPSSYRPGTAVPLVFALHGGGGDASKMYDPETRIIEYAESKGTIAIFPNGLPKPGAPAGSTNYYWTDPVNIGFMNHLIDLAIARFTIDTRRIYFIGFSGGAKLIYHLAENPTISSRIAAIATVAGEMGGKQLDPPTSPWEIIDPSVSGGMPMSALLLQGGNDKKLPEMGGFNEDFDRISTSFQVKVDTWRFFAGAKNEVSIESVSAPPRVELKRYVNPATGHTVISALDPNLAHRWPEWNFAGEIFEFFERVPTR